MLGIAQASLVCSHSIAKVALPSLNRSIRDSSCKLDSPLAALGVLRSSLRRRRNIIELRSTPFATRPNESEFSIIAVRSKFLFFLGCCAFVHKIDNVHIGNAGIVFESNLAGTAVGIPDLNVIGFNLRAEFP